jgi:hypothetical protein
VGGHLALNHHPDLVLDDRRTVLDLERRSFSVDLRIGLTDFVRLTGMFGAGVVLDDFDADERDDYQYRGWEGSAVVMPLPGLLHFAYRYEGYADERYENGIVDVLHGFTLGATVFPLDMLRLSLNYKWKRLDSEQEPEIDDDALLLLMQAAL